MKRGSVSIFPHLSPGSTPSQHILRIFRSRLAGVAVLLSASAGAWGQATFTATAVGATSASQNVTVTATVAGTVSPSGVEVLTAGASSKDFAIGTGSSTCPAAVLALNGTCTESVNFTPSAPGTRIGAVVLLDAGSNVLGVAYLQGTGAGALGVAIPGNEISFAGGGAALGDGGAATAAQLDLPAGVALDGAGNLYIADSAHNRIRMVCAGPSSGTIAGTSASCTGAGIITTIAGNGTAGPTGNGGPASAALLNNPSGVAIDGAGNLYIADTGNNEIREIIAATGNIVLFAGNGTAGYSGDGAAATSAMLNQPLGVSLDASGNVYIADTANARIREVALSTGNITTVVGNGTAGYGGDGLSATSASTEINLPYAVAFDASGYMYIPDSGNNRIRVVKSGTISTFAGTGAAGNAGDGGLAISAQLLNPSGVAVDAAGNVYIADTGNNAIRKVNATGTISSLVADGIGEFYAGGLFSPVALSGPIGLALDGSGNLYIADAQSMMVRQIQGNSIALDFTTPIPQGLKSTPMPATIENDGNLALDLTTITAGTNTALDTPTTTCIAGPPDLSVDANCIVGAVFAPTTSGNPVTGTITLASATANSPVTLTLVGDALPANATVTTVTSNPNPSSFGVDVVTFTVTVTTGTTPSNLTGKVSISDTYNGVTTAIATGLTVNASGVATFPTASLSVGKHSIVAAYSNDSSHLSSSSTDYGAPALIQTVLEETSTALTSTPNPSLLGSPAAFTATVTAPHGGGVQPDGTVTLMDETNTPVVALGTPTVLVSGVAMDSISFSTVGVHHIIAVYNGDPSKQIVGSISNEVDQDVQAPTTVTVTSSVNPSSYGQSVTFTAATSASPIAATGTVAFVDNGTQIGTGTLIATTASGTTPSISTATFTTSKPATASTLATPTLSVGVHPITVTYAGDKINNSPGATATALNQIVLKAQTSVAVTAVPNPGIAGKAVTLTATITLTTPGSDAFGGTVTFTSGTTVLGSNTVTNGAATFNANNLAPGTYQIVATYSGDANTSGSVSAALPLTVNLATTTTTFTVKPNPAVVVAPITFTATVAGNGGVPTGTVSFFNGATLLGTGTLNAQATATFTTTTLAAGTYSVTATYSGDANDAPSTSAVTSLIVNLIPTSTDLSASTTVGANPQTILTAVVVGTSGPVPTGTVTLTSGGTTLGTGTLDSNGVFSLTPTLAPGNYTVVASYSGDTLHAPSTSAPVTVSSNPVDFKLSVSPTSVTLKASQNIPLTVNLTSEGGFTDTIGLGCASLPAGVSCIFANPSVTLAANGTASVQLSIDTNTPIGGGSTAMNHRGSGTSGMSMAGLFLPLSAFFGWLLWRVRRRNMGFFTLVLAIALSAGALFATGCSGYSSSTAKPGSYVIQVIGTGTNTQVIHYQNISLTITN